MKTTLAALLLLGLAGCAPETKTVDRPDTAPMELPEWGWTISFVRTVNDDEPSEPAEYDCLIARSTSGTAADYCGYLVAVSGDGFSFDGEWYRAHNFFYGPLLIRIRGAGDAEGAEIAVEAQYRGEDGEPLGLAYTLDFDITHIGEIE